MYEITSLSQLPSIERTISVSRGLALLDAVIMPDWQYRYFSFNADWAGDGSQMVASMRDGCGSDYFILFDAVGAAGGVRSLAMANGAPSLAAVPEDFHSFKTEPAFSLEEASYYFWRRHGQADWNVEPERLYAYDFLSFLVDGGRSTENGPKPVMNAILTRKLSVPSSPAVASPPIKSTV